MQPPAMAPWAQVGITVAALIVAVSYSYYAVSSSRLERNAALVSIGVSVLRADPAKEKDISTAAREWALDLIDANAGVKFSKAARDELLKNSLHLLGSGAGYTDYGYVDTYGKNLGYVDTHGPGAAPPPKTQPAAAK
jgi:hypothetical protein